MTEKTFRIKAITTKGHQMLVKARDLEFYIDEPKEMGGHNLGPNPIEYLMTGLVGCMNVVGQIVAREMKIVIGNIEFIATAPLNVDGLLGKPTEDRVGLKKIKIKVKVESNAAEATLQQWFDTVEKRCPVSDNITNPTPISFKLEKQPYNP